MIKKIISGACAGILISIGGTVYLSCDNKYVGAVLFSVALLCICIKGYSLFTGKVGYLPEKHGKEEFSVLLLGLLGNFVGTVACGYLLRYVMPAIGTSAAASCATKLTQTTLQTFVRAIFCGFLMYLAVSIYRDSKTVVGIIFCIPVFILSGFEHSIADMFYFAASGIVSLRAFAFIFVVIAGNAVGAITLSLMTLICKRKES